MKPKSTTPFIIPHNTEINLEKYKKLYAASLKDLDGFWNEQGKRIDWIKPYTKIKNTRFTYPDINIKWYEDGILNACVNCVDRHLPTRTEQVAFYWEGDEPNTDKKITYGMLYENVCKLANIYKELGVKKGDRVIIYMPMIPEAIYAMLACARIGAIHSVVFGGFSSDALASRIKDCQASLVVTADQGVRGGKIIPLKNNVDKALETCDSVKLLMVNTTDKGGNIVSGRDYIYNDMMQNASTACPPEKMKAEDPLFILYTSGSTGKPKGILHTTGGYLVYSSMTHQYAFDYNEGDIFWCTADVGWITGHSYIVYGPLTNAASSVIFEGIPTYPDAGRFWAICEKYKVNQFYTAPTAIRALMRMGDDFVKPYDLSTLKVLGTVGESINPDVWKWYYNVIGKSRLPIVDTWWQTETGAQMIAPLANIIPPKPGAASLPFWGIQPVIIDPHTGDEITEKKAKGVLCFKDSWPGQMRGVYGDHDCFIKTYFTDYKGYYFTGDGCERDEDGYYWMSGRVDDVINVAGHRLGTAEIESALVAHPKIAEAAVIGCPHEIKGQAIYCYVTLMAKHHPNDMLRDELCDWIRHEIGSIATPDYIQWAPNLPKTRSGKIMRRILRKIAENDFENLGDISTLAEPHVVEELIATHLKDTNN